MPDSPTAAGTDPLRTAFVTGAGGLLGYWLVQALLAREVRVVVLQRDSAARTALRLDGLDARCTVVQGDLLDARLLEQTLAEHAVDSVFHLAAQSIVGAGAQSPIPTFETNVRGTWLLLEACRVQEVERVVVASTDRAYGPPRALPYAEGMPLDARQPYDVSKAAADLIARSYFHTYGLPVGVVRFTNVYGGGDLNRSRLVPELVGAVLAGRSPQIHTDGSPKRDFLHASDAAAAALAVAGMLGAGTQSSPATAGGPAAGQAFNAGGGTVTSVRDATDLLIRIAGAGVTAEYGDAPVTAGEVDREPADTARLRTLTGWAPRKSLEDGLRDTVAWYRDHPGTL
ncbi:dTDP-glucose 4,6-dehydratase [Paraconexibacter sp. AEG42_29]|uniref:dTDP-glucose 4,6-dehydratase n=1 Tax=Paraconexibacter sp. AEG42_29 TaxID=2997339 RepID=A0AAU7AVX2_9ACTN